ncbi:WecB/TagA/CpsF family glycosyltransferase [Halovulum dunhuangense]|uniref:WecB/TagA/CpsF family glycosyltransferase n=1 Tax=Halovulum dunhuangense TaxID=1505036 RepID=A0A849L1Z8_9RHOB|nr:WecB/TagA/CpsF family glycosyltransferase [Halovulum dunhuangense]NNU80295.1 WecB/TagA/CpsF family glycosyltransferase [Halovulum dunhuangense]
MKAQHIMLGGVPVATLTEAGLVARMLEDCAQRRARPGTPPVLVFDSNAQAISLRATDPAYAAALSGADIVHADGQAVVWLSRLRRGPQVPERTATTDLIHAAARAAEGAGLGFYLLGGTEEVNRRCAERLVQLYPRLRLAGRRNGYFPCDEEAAVCDAVAASGADVVWVGLGKPREQVFAHANRERLGCGWVVTCGGCFNFVAGDYRRAPRWMQRAGLEWLHRAATGPRYLVGRYAVTIPHALWQVVRRDLLGAREDRHAG